MPVSPSLRPAFALVLLAGLVAAGCSRPALPFVSGRYAVTGPDGGEPYCASRIRRERGGVVEFRDARNDAWVSIPGATVRELSAEEFRACLAR
jgi:hypothetical protein